MRLFCPGGWLFLLCVVAGLSVVAIVDADLVVESFRQAWTLTIKLAPLFILVILMMALSETFLDARWIGRWVGRSSGPRGWLIALAAGTLSVGPMHVWVAILQDLRAKGMREGLIVGFSLFPHDSNLLPSLDHRLFWLGLHPDLDCSSDDLCRRQRTLDRLPACAQCRTRASRSSGLSSAGGGIEPIHPISRGEAVRVSTERVLAACLRPPIHRRPRGAASRIRCVPSDRCRSRQCGCDPCGKVARSSPRSCSAAAPIPCGHNLP